jgi:Asp-tRNA(Asn)/Glu-tRNA(Gln) amidotransferase A subunit family amidase
VPADAWQTAADIAAGRASAVEVVSACLKRIHQLQPSLNAFTIVLDDQATDAARLADDAVRAGGALPPLLGVPVAVKDHIWMSGVPATNGSLALRDFIPEEDAVPVARLRAAGAIIVGKTNNPEFCYRGFTDNLLYGLTRNPWDVERTPGGSSGGAGACVATDLTAIALGTDGGGSIRIPASFCGVVGHKPTFGLVPKEPGFKGWKTISVDGPLARSVRDAALMLSVMCGEAPADDMSFPGPSVDHASVTLSSSDLQGLRMAWSVDLGMLPVDRDVRAVFTDALTVFAELGCELVEACPQTSHPTELWNTIALTEGYSSEGPLLERWRDQMAPGSAEIIEAGRSITGAQYVDALHDKARYSRVWSEFFERYDLLVTPTTQLTAFPVGLETPQTIADQVVDPFFDDWCAISLPANLTGMPATSVPAGFGDGGLPIGLQIMGPRWSDSLTLRAAAAFEQRVPWTRFLPAL